MDTQQNWSEYECLNHNNQYVFLKRYNPFLEDFIIWLVDLELFRQNLDDGSSF